MTTNFVPGQVAHFSINTDNISRSRKFWETVFGWKFHAYGPPGFYMIETCQSEPAPMLASLQSRRELVEGVKVHGFECTIAVSDLNQTIELIQQEGGKILMPRCTLPSIGHLCFFEDLDGNHVGAMQYDPNAS